MIVLGIVFLLVGGLLIIGGINVNNDLEAQIDSFFNNGTTDPGSSIIVIGVFTAVVGLIMLMVGIVQYLQKNRSGQNASTFSGNPVIGKCWNCGSLIMHGTEYCSRCGTKVYTQQNKFCRYCGKSINSTAAFCPYCGNQIQTK